MAPPTVVLRDCDFVKLCHCPHVYKHMTLFDSFTCRHIRNMCVLYAHTHTGDCNKHYLVYVRSAITLSEGSSYIPMHNRPEVLRAVARYLCTD